MIGRGAASVAGVLVDAAILLVVASTQARAVSPAAEALFQEGRRLLAAGQIDEACARFAESYAVDASSGTLLNLALCHEKQGKSATAWAEYRGAARLARNQGREDRAGAADDKVAVLEAKLPRVTSISAKPVPGLRIATEDGTLGEGGLGVAVPVDPGSHKVTVSAPGYRPWATTVEMKEGEQRTLEIPELEAEPVPAMAPGPGTGSLAVTGARATTGGAAPDRSRLDLYLVSGGGLLLVGGVAFWAIAYAKLQAAVDACNGIVSCSDSDRTSRISTITTLKELTIGSWIAGGALVIAAGVHYKFFRNPTPLTVALDPVNRAVAIGGLF